MKVPFLTGEFELTIDSKNRLLVPSEVRRQLVPETDGEALYVTLRHNNEIDRLIPLFYPETYYKELATSQIKPDMTPSKDVLAYTQLKFALATRIEWDNQGRIVLPDKVLKRTGLVRDVTLIGQQDHLELWDREAWAVRRDQLYRESADIEARGKAALDGQPKV